MKKFTETIKRYRFFFILALINIIIFILNPSLGQNAFKSTWKNTIEMLKIIPPIFVLLGLLDVWIQRETMVKYMGEGSGFVGILISFLLGSAAAGPLYAAFPVAGVFLKKGVKFSNVLIMLGAWSTTKIPLLLFEASSMGLKFTILRFLLNLIGIWAIAFLTEKTLSKPERDEIYNRAIIRED